MRFAKLGVHDFQLLYRFMLRCSIGGEFLVESRKFSVQIGGFCDRWLGRNERAGSEVVILESAVEPEAELPADLQAGQRSTMVTGHGVAGGVAGSTNFSKELSNIARQNALILEAAE